MKLQIESPKPEWLEEQAWANDLPHEATDAMKEVFSDEEPKLSVRVLDTAKRVAHQLWEKKKDTCCVLPQNNVLLSEKCCIGKLLRIQQLKEKFITKRAEEGEKI